MFHYFAYEALIYYYYNYFLNFFLSASASILWFGLVYY